MTEGAATIKPGTYRIIIAEDYASLASILTRLILRHVPSVEVQAFDNEPDALARYVEAGADLLFCNHSMPRMDGPTLVRTLRACGDSVPIIGILCRDFIEFGFGEQLLEAAGDVERPIAATKVVSQLV